MVHSMTLFYDNATQQWYDPRAPMVGRYARTNVTGKSRSQARRPAPTGPPTMYIQNLYSQYSRAGRVAAASAAALGRR